MNTRRRVISPTQAVFVGPSPASGDHSGAIEQLHRIQTANWGFTLNRQDVSQFGQLAPIDRVTIESPTVNLDFSYLVTDVVNESKLGFSVNGGVSVLSGILNGSADERNYFILTVPEGNDAAGFTAESGSIIGVGNGFLSNYTIEGAVGGFPTASVTVEGLNMEGYLSGNNQPVPAVNPQNGAAIVGVNFDLPGAISGEVGQITAIQPGDITLDLANAGLFVDLSGISIQSFSCSFDLARDPIQALGYKFNRSRELTFPINVTFSVDVLAGDITTGSLSNVLCNDLDYDMSVTMRAPSCAGNGATAVRLDIRGAKLDTQNWQNSIGSNGTVSLQWTSQIGGPQSVTDGLFMSGIATYA
jgi:hypothetical protein